jgi:hypothetical protein
MSKPVMNSLQSRQEPLPDTRSSICLPDGTAGSARLF